MKPSIDTLVIACGALAHEIQAIKKSQNLAFDIACLNANLHNRPNLIPEKVEAAILANQDNYQRIFVAYADCGTAGQLDKTLAKYGVERLGGVHCYQFYSQSQIADWEDEMGVFYLTDFIAKHFDRLILQELGINDSPELLPMYFGNYHSLLYMSQQANFPFREQAQKAALALGLDYQEKHTGYGQLEVELKRLPINEYIKNN